MSFCDMVVGAHRLDKTPLTDLSTQTTIKKETIDPAEQAQEDTNGSGNKQHSKPAAAASSSSGETSGTGGARQSFCWADQVIKEEQEEEEKLRTKSNTDMQNNSDSRMSVDDSNTSGNRQIEIDILDSANVHKYEKLIRCDMIKSPFKRRLSGGGDEEDDGEDGAIKREDAQAQHKKSKTHEDDHGRDRFRRESTDSGDGSSQSSRRPVEYEKDIEILVRRQKQIDYGKNTLGYENYLRQVPKEQRTKEHPKTPPKHIKYSRRAWDGLVRVWRKKLHCFDPDARPDNTDAAADDN